MADSQATVRDLAAPNRMALRNFASDNYSGVHPEILEAIAAANAGPQPAYGADSYTERLQQLAKAHFGQHAEMFPVFNGTGANVVALDAMLPRWGAVITTATAHINTDEGGAPERVAGPVFVRAPVPTERTRGSAVHAAVSAGSAPSSPRTGNSLRS